VTTASGTTSAAGRRARKTTRPPGALVTGAVSFTG
jgi:hypothetical protein